MDRETALKIAGGFGGGMGRMAGTCGAVTGAFMVIGLVHSMTKKGDLQQKELSYEYIRKFAEKFRERNGTLVCRELMGVDVSTPEGFAESKAKEHRPDHLPEVCPGRGGDPRGDAGRFAQAVKGRG